MRDTTPRRFVAALERLTPPQLAAGALALVCGPLIGTVWATGALDAVLIVASALGALGAGALALHRRRLDALPLELSPVALATTERGHRVYRFRARLGHGRVLRAVGHEVRFELPDGSMLTLPTAIPHLSAVVGPWTILVDDGPGLCDRPGVFRVRAWGREGARTWETERVYPREALQPGRFARPAERWRGRLALSPDWDAVEPA